MIECFTVGKVLLLPAAHAARHYDALPCYRLPRLEAAARHEVPRNQGPRAPVYAHTYIVT